MPGLLMMRVPKQVVKAGNGIRRSKYLRQSDPALAELSAEEAQQTHSHRGSVAGNVHYYAEGGINGSGLPAPDKLNGELRNHLDSIFSGFQKLIAGTAQAVQVRKLPFVVEKTIHNILFIKTHIQRQDEFDAEDQDWGIVAMVLDRLFLWIFGAAAVVGSFMILTESPSLFETTEPIDVKFSKISQEEARLMASIV